jgi:hypothetical protein
VKEGEEGEEEVSLKIGRNPKTKQDSIIAIDEMKQQAYKS